MKTKLIALMLVGGGSMFAQSRFSVGVQIGSSGYYAPAPYAAYRPPLPGPGYVWVDGYQDEYGRWIEGCWALPPYEGAYWVAPRYYGGRFIAGFWGGERRYYRDDFRFRESRDREFRGNEFREREGIDRRNDFNRGQGQSFDRRGGAANGGFNNWNSDHRNGTFDHGNAGRNFRR